MAQLALAGRWSEASDSSEWDDFVVQNDGSIFHTWSWRRVLESDDLRPLYLAYRDSDGRILAVCPFIYRAGKRLLYLESLPHSYTAGPIIDSQLTNISQIIVSLRKSVKSSPFHPIAAMMIKAHQQRVIRSMIALGFPYDARYGLFVLDLHEKTLEHIWNEGFQKHDRQAVKYYEHYGSGFRFAIQESDYLDYLALQRPDYSHDTGRLPRADFLLKMRSNLGGQLKVAIATFEDKVVAGLTMLCDPANSTVHLAANRYSRGRNIHSPMTYVNWQAVNWASEHGFRYVDFGPYSVALSLNPVYPFCKLTKKFGLVYVPRYRFTLPISNVSYSTVRMVNRVLSVGRDPNAAN